LEFLEADDLDQGLLKYLNSNSAISGLSVSSVQSKFVTSAATGEDEDCQSVNNADANTICKHVQTSIVVHYNPQIFSSSSSSGHNNARMNNIDQHNEIVQLYITSTTLQYFSTLDDTTSIHLVTPQLIELTSQINMQLNGVASKYAFEPEVQTLTDSVQEFLQGVFMDHEPPMAIVDVSGDDDSPSARVVNGSRELSRRRQLKKSTSIYTTPLRMATDPVLSINVTVSGEYLLPDGGDDIIENTDFGILIESYFEHDTALGESGEFLSILLDSGDLYFANVQKVYVVPVVESDPITDPKVTTVVQVDDSSDDDGPFGALGDVGGVALLVACNVVLIGMVAVYWIKQSEAKEKRLQQRAASVSLANKDVEEDEDAIVQEQDDEYVVKEEEGKKDDDDFTHKASNVTLVENFLVEDFSSIGLERYPFNEDPAQELIVNLGRGTGNTSAAAVATTDPIQTKPTASVLFDPDLGTSKEAAADNQGYSIVN